MAERTRELNLSLGRVEEIGRFPNEPYGIELRADGGLYRAAADMKEHERADRLFREELQRRVARSPNKEVTLYVHGFNETFATAAFTAAEMCHFLGREPVCAFFSWPASSTGNFLTSYSRTTESAAFAEDHKVDYIVYEGTRTDSHGHFYFTTSPRVSSDVIQLLRYGKKPSDPGRALIKVAPIVWKFPRIEK